MRPSHSELQGTRRGALSGRVTRFWLRMGKGLVGQSGRAQAQFSSEQLRGNPTTFPSRPVTQIPHQQGRIMPGTNQPMARTNSSIFSLPGGSLKTFLLLSSFLAYSVSEQVAVICRVGCTVVSSMLLISGIAIFRVSSHFCTVVCRHRKQNCSLKPVVVRSPCGSVKIWLSSSCH